MCFYLSGTTHIIFKWRRLLFNFWDALHHSVHYPSIFYKWIHEFFQKKGFYFPMKNSCFTTPSLFYIWDFRTQRILLYVTNCCMLPKVTLFKILRMVPNCAKRLICILCRNNGQFGPGASISCQKFSLNKSVLKNFAEHLFS